MTGIITWQIFDRYILNDSPNWSEKLSIFIMNWYVLLAVAVGVHESFHLGIDLVRNKMPATLKKFIDVSIYLLIGYFACSMFIYGIALMTQTWTHVIPSLGISTAWSYLPLPISGVLIVLFSIEHLLLIFTSKES
jgi:TRAP-type C4-dicarboxylate transport system permease small subunit